MQWQPIETAPKDGVVLICGFGELGYWVEAAEVRQGVAFVYDPYEDCFGLPQDSATHWMPLPEPPKTAAIILGQEGGGQ